MKVIQARKVCFALLRNLLFFAGTTLLSFLSLSFVSDAAFADDSISISTSTSVNLLAHGGESAIGSSEVEIITTCHAGYTLTLSTSVNNNGLYLNGDASTAASGYFAPSNGSTPLSLASNTWGYSLAVLRPGASEYAPPTINDSFSAVPNSSSLVSIKTPESTQSETDIDDRFSIYYGVNASSGNIAGNYTLIDDPNTPGTPGVLVYTAITSPACNSDLTVVFGKNAGSDEVTNLPTASENVFDPLNNTLTLSSKRPERAGYIFKEWNTNPNGSGDSFPVGAVIHIGTGEGELIGNVTLYAIWETDSATLLPGQELNPKIKTLAEGSKKGFYEFSYRAKALRMTNSLPAGFTPSNMNTVSTSDSTYPIYIFFDNTNDAGIVYFYTEARDIYMNEDSSFAFSCFTNLSDISALSSWDTSRATNMKEMFSQSSSFTDIDALASWDIGNVTDMSRMFSYASALTNINGAANWDTSSVTTTEGMFSHAYSLTNIDGAANWDTSKITSMNSMFDNASSLTNIDGASGWNTENVTDMGYMFFNASSLTNINGAANWDTGSVTNMGSMFSFFPLTNIDALLSWDTSSVTDMSNMFEDAAYLLNINGAANWDTSSVTDMSFMFYAAFLSANLDTNIDGAANWDTSSVTTMEGMFSLTAITNIDALSGWDTGSVINMLEMFEMASALTNIDGAANWDTSSVTNMKGMFACTAIADASAINDWEIGNVTATAGSSSEENNNFYRMFYNVGGNGSPTHPEFTKRIGTWDTNGTFIPSPSPYAVTVNMDEGVSKITFSNSAYGTQEVINQSSGAYTDTITLYENMIYDITATTAPGFSFSSWSTDSAGNLSDTAVNPATFFITGSSTITATSNDIRLVINYDGNGLYYNDDPSDTINQVVYQNNRETITKYSHTSNISDAGIVNGTYNKNLSATNTVTINGATSLNVTIYYDTEGTSYDWVSVYQSPFNISNTYDATATTYTGNLSGKLAGRKSGRTTSYTTWYSKTYTVTGDTVKFHFRSDSRSNYYGYYAIVTAVTGSFDHVSGTYATPSSNTPCTFLGWSEDQNATTPTYTDEQDIMNNATYTHADSPVTLYAICVPPDTVTVNLDEHSRSVVATAGASSIDNNNFFMMFAYTQSHPNFTRRAGT